MIRCYKGTWVLAFMTVIGLPACGFDGGTAGGHRIVVLEGATLFDGTGGPPRPGSVIVIEEERIVAVGDEGRVRYPAGAEVVDVRGRYIVPGFMDLHVHNINPARDGYHPEVTRNFLRMLLAYGITTMLNPGVLDPVDGMAEHAAAVRDSVAAGQLVGPRMFTAGPIIDTQAQSAEEVRAHVRRHAAAGVDYVKLYRSLTSEMTGAGIDEAHSLGIKTIAHTSATTWPEAVASGIDILTHAGPGISSLMTPQQRSDYVAYGRRAQRLYIPFEWIKPIQSDSAFLVLAQSLASANIPVEPTLVVYEATFWADSPRYSEQPEAAFVHERVLESWRKQPHTGDWTAADFRRARAAWPVALDFTRLLYENGVLLVSGTDAGEALLVPGVSFHRNLELLAEAGIPSAEVLRIATRNGAQALGILDETGTVESGKLADLVLLTANPMMSIANTRRIEWVMRQGERYEPADLLQRGFPSFGVTP